MDGKVSLDNCEFVFIVSDDHDCSVGWIEPSDVKLDDSEIYCSGWIIKESSKFILLAADIDKTNGHINRTMVVPKLAIKSIKRVVGWEKYVKVQKKRRRGSLRS